MPTRKSTAHPKPGESLFLLHLVPEAKNKAYRLDCRGFFAVSTILDKLRDIERVPLKRTAPILRILIDFLLHANSEEMTLRETILRARASQLEKQCAQLQRTLMRSLFSPPAPPATLKEHMLRISLDAEVTRLAEGRHILAALKTGIKATQRIKKDYGFHGRHVASSRKAIMAILVPALQNIKKASEYTQQILAAWERSSAPESAEHIRTDYPRSKRLIRPRS